MASEQTQRRLAAILSADVVGYSRLMAEDEDATVRTVTAYREQVGVLIRQHRGRVVDAPGDNLLAEFPTATDAVEAATEIQRVIRARNAAVPEGRRMEFRIGVHLGEARAEGDRLYGDAVNVAARLEGLAEPGGLCISDDVLHQIQPKLDLEFEDLGAQEVKNIPNPVHVYRVREATATSVKVPLAPRRVPRPAVAAFAVAAFLAIAAAAYLVFGGRAPTEAGAPLTSIAVLPFDDMSPGGDSAWLANGMAEEVIETLSRISAFRVVARTSAEIAKRSGDDLDGIGRALQVGSLVEGSVRRSGDQLRITAQLIRVADASHLWSARYDRKLEDVFAVQREIARDIAEAIRVELGVRTSWSWLEREQYVPRDVHAYELVRRGWDLQLTLQQKDVLEAGELFREAIRLDPQYAAAHGSLAWHHNILWGLYDRSNDQKQFAVDAATRALELDPLQGYAHHFLALLSLGEWDFEAAEKRLVHALELHPEQAGLRQAYGFVLLETGRVDEGCAQLKKAAELDPLFAGFQTDVAACHGLRGEYDAAIEKIEYALTLNPLHPNATGDLGMNYHLKGMDAEALEAYVRTPGVDPEFEAALRLAFQKDGWLGLNRAFIQTLVTRSGRPCFLEPAIGAHLYARAGERDDMYRCLELAIAERGNRLLALRFARSWDPYRDEPRFQEILRRLGLVE